MPKSDGRSVCLEAARAAALAAHSAAGLATAAGLREAARLLRSSEAMARAAAAVLTPSISGPTTSRPAGQADDATAGAAPVPARTRRRGKKKKTTQVEAALECSGVAEVLLVGGGPVASPAPLSADALEFKPARVLKPQTSRERSPRRGPDSALSSPPSATTAGSASGTTRFVVNQPVALTGLVSRPDLEGLRAVVLSIGSAAERYAVKVDTTNECVRVRETSLRACG